MGNLLIAKEELNEARHTSSCSTAPFLSSLHRTTPFLVSHSLLNPFQIGLHSHLSSEIALKTLPKPMVISVLSAQVISAISLWRVFLLWAFLVSPPPSLTIS